MTASEVDRLRAELELLRIRVRRLDDAARNPCIGHEERLVVLKRQLRTLVKEFE